MTQSSAALSTTEFFKLVAGERKIHVACPRRPPCFVCEGVRKKPEPKSTELARQSAFSMVKNMNKLEAAGEVGNIVSI